MPYPMKAHKQSSLGGGEVGRVAGWIGWGSAPISHLVRSTSASLQCVVLRACSCGWAWLRCDPLISQRVAHCCHKCRPCVWSAALCPIVPVLTACSTAVRLVLRPARSLACRSRRLLHHAAALPPVAPGDRNSLGPGSGRGRAAGPGTACSPVVECECESHTTCNVSWMMLGL